LLQLALSILLAFISCFDTAKKIVFKDSVNVPRLRRRTRSPKMIWK
jgi:hypothetical protein